MAYTNNHPVLYDDPTGHDVGCPGADASSCGSASSNNKRNKRDAKLLTLNFAVGAGPVYLIWGYDAVITDKEVGFFTTLSVGPIFNNDTATSVSREDEDKALISSQASVSVLYGDVYGDSLKDNVKNYRGTSFVGGASWGPITSEHFSSINPITGKVDYRVSGDATGVTMGLDMKLPGEVHNY
jgi:hypothetical protein